MVKLALFLHFTMIAALQFFHSMIHNKVCGATSFVSAVVMVSVPLPLFHGCCVYNDFAALWHDEMAISCEVGAEGSVIYWVHFCNVPTFFYLSMMALVGGQFSFVFLCCAKFHACKSKMDIVVMSIFGSGMQCRCSLAWPFVAVCVLSC